MIQSSKGVFLSYASEDTGVAKGICDTFRIAGIEVWFDQSELRGGDAWDQKIRQQIRDCALFVPIISAHTQTRPEGYFRLEWKLAVDRSHLMAAEKAFLVPVVVDATTEPEALVPAQFREVQWTRLQAGEVPVAFVERIAALLNQPVAHHVGSPERAVNRTPTRRLPVALIALSVAAVVALAIAAAMRGGWSGHKPVPKVEAGTAAASVATTPAAVPEKSIAVLPFVDMSEKQDEGYFSDGLSEELIDMLTKVPDLRVPARTSSFFFKGKQTTIKEIAAALGVAHVLEGSVRKSGKTVRITAQLIRVDNGYHLWSETYDRKLEEIFKLQDEIARAVVAALKLSLGNALRPKGPATQNIDAYGLYLQALDISHHAAGRADSEKVVAFLDRALSEDPRYAAALALKSTILDDLGKVKEARAAAELALKMDPMLPDTHTSMARLIVVHDWDISGAEGQLQQALQLDPDDSFALAWVGMLAAVKGESARAINSLQRAIALDPVNPIRYRDLSDIYYLSGRFSESLDADHRMRDLNPRAPYEHANKAQVLLAKGDAAAALAELDLETDEDARLNCSCRTLIYDVLSRKADADASLVRLKATHAGDDAYGIGRIYAGRKELDQAFRWFDRAYANHDWELMKIRADPLLKNVRSDPRFKAVLRKLNLPY